MGPLIVTLEETKLWLRVEHSDEDALIESFIAAAEELVEGILRFPLSEFEVSIPEAIKYAVFFTVSKFYEERNELNMEEINSVLKALLFSYRKVDW
ncbi:head-tail connector protein [Clostridium thermarum]|uniref:head-tail connector protein n=1 Tax=Clostridium thermarum TaxID=1716543 RepID=UPI001FAB3349|nr:head-tail connector protein [Clostridium thermarum]